MFKLENIVKKYGEKVVLDNLNITIEDGEMIAIMGESGSGKSTLLNILGLLESFDSGTYQLDNEQNVKPNSRLANKIIRENITYIFQNYALIDNQTVTSNLSLAQKYVKEDKQAKNAQIKEVLDTVGLSGYENHKVFELSGGQQQRVSIARCLLKPSNLVLADEPTGSLDEKNRDIILKELKLLNQKGKTVIIVTHDLEVAHSCSKIINL
ncbi:MAG: putative bacteriocin export ABC transporter [Streptococcaceae bacterium]|jgi:putative ABC transport system ATP-binding protein|nr:putative bacteriocin export ABC transporter [Streptococcaceae bacterium]